MWAKCFTVTLWLAKNVQSMGRNQDYSVHQETQKQSKRWNGEFQKAKLGDMVRNNPLLQKKRNVLIKKFYKAPFPSPFLPRTIESLGGAKQGGCLCHGQPRETQWATAGWGRLPCVRRCSQKEESVQPGRGRAGMGHQSAGRAQRNVHAGKEQPDAGGQSPWGTEGTHAGRWPGAGQESSRGVRRKKDSPAKRTELCLGWEGSPKGTGKWAHGYIQGTEQIY